MYIRCVWMLVKTSVNRQYRLFNLHDPLNEAKSRFKFVHSLVTPKPGMSVGMKALATREGMEGEGH